MNEIDYDTYGEEDDGFAVERAKDTGAARGLLEHLVEDEAGGPVKIHDADGHVANTGEKRLARVVDESEWFERTSVDGQHGTVLTPAGCDAYADHEYTGRLPDGVRESVADARSEEPRQTTLTGQEVSARGD